MTCQVSNLQQRNASLPVSARTMPMLHSEDVGSCPQRRGHGAQPHPVIILQLGCMITDHICALVQCDFLHNYLH